MNPASSRAADLLLIGVTFVWGAMFVLAKQALADVSSGLYLALRFSLAALVLALLFRRRVAGGFTRAELSAGALTGALLMAGYLLQTLGLATISPSRSAFLTGTYVVLVPFLGFCVYRNRPRWFEVVGVAVAGLGMALLSAEGERWTIGRGEWLTIACAVCFAGHIVMLGHFAPRLGYESLSLLQVASAALCALLATPLLESPVIRWRPAVIAAIVAGGLLATALAFVVQTWAQQFTSPTRAAVIFCLEPVFACLVAWLATGETLDRRAAWGAGLILAGVLLVELKPFPKTAHPLL